MLFPSLCLQSTGYSPIMVAAEYGREEIVTLLLSKGASGTLRNKLTHTGPELADWYGHSDIVRLLTAVEP